MDKGPSHYDILGVAETASKAEIEATYLRRKREFHPELNQEWLATLREAYDVLSDEQAREAYDQKREQERLKQAAAKKAELKPPPAEINLLFDEVETPLSRRASVEVPASSVWLSPFDFDALRFRPSTEPATRPVPPLRTFTPPSQPTITRDSPWRGVAVVGAIIVVLLIFALARGGSARHSVAATAEPSASTLRHQAAQAATERQITAERKIAHLSFECIDRYACHADPDGHPLPVFVNGMDENLRVYLQKQGYKDEWSDSAGKIHGQTIGPNSEPEGVFGYAYVSSSREEGGREPQSVATGMTYNETGEHGNPEARGIIPWDVTGNARWRITWKLRNPSGQTVKTLRHSVRLVECEGAGEIYCEKVINYEKEAPPGESAVYGGSYSAERYSPPLAFDKPPESEVE